MTAFDPRESRKELSQRRTKKMSRSFPFPIDSKTLFVHKEIKKEIKKTNTPLTRALNNTHTDTGSLNRERPLAFIVDLEDFKGHGKIMCRKFPSRSRL